MGAISLNSTSFHRWLEEAPAGNLFEYHRGFLPHDRGDKTVDRLAVSAAEAYLDGQVALTQTRHGQFDYSYLAEKR